ncbi:hypothetical protein M2105_002429 [Paenibacillus sp. PastF-1]|nr:hypothetical protein [Paenibacillus sp. PastF-2]MDF9848004.1 hypothetical protein [Paenibacillus sp. PastM-2]MDF9854572.1 hypothetical protein [Paenibacillus sp. PastF-1]MDH6479819.1 hypothetical protein [Paenibacillus sp. PastH-2]MDH6507279.1 hypothetical protein [Paenibacillus sp. PastM-3]
MITNSKTLSDLYSYYYNDFEEAGIMSTASRKFMNEGVLRIAIFIMFASLTYSVRNYTWAIVALLVVGTYSLVTGIVQLRRSRHTIE